MKVRFSPTRLKLLGTGSALPGTLVHNDELLRALQTHCGQKTARRALKYAQRLGINSRYLSRDLKKRISGTVPGSQAPELCAGALKKAAGSTEISYLIGHTATPHTLLPPNISWVADSMRYDGPYVELRQACTGFANALTMAAAMIAEDPQSKIGIVGSENGSPFFDISNDFAVPEQLINFVQMGDGAGAVLLGRDDDSGSGIISDIYFGQCGLDAKPGISIAGGGSGQPSCEAGLPFFDHSARHVRQNGEQLLLNGIKAIGQRGYQLDDFQWFLPHQAHGQIAKIFAGQFPATEGKVVNTADRLGNLGSAAIWVALDELVRSGKLRSGDKVLVLGAEASKFLLGGFVYTH
jgi:3-oxoacyl-[acyl-carrier-protein] synthase-3